MLTINYRKIEARAAECDVRTERGRDADGPYIRLAGKLSDVQDVLRALPDGHVSERGYSSGYYVRRVTN
jgi:hypothetical protein